MPKISVKKEFTMPGKPQFTTGSVFSVSDEIASLAVQRGLAEVVKLKKTQKAEETKPKKESNKKTQKSNKLKDE